MHTNMGFQCWRELQVEHVQRAMKRASWLITGISLEISLHVLYFMQRGCHHRALFRSVLIDLWFLGTPDVLIFWGGPLQWNKNEVCTQPKVCDRIQITQMTPSELSLCSGTIKWQNWIRLSQDMLRPWAVLQSKLVASADFAMQASKSFWSQVNMYWAPSWHITPQLMFLGLPLTEISQQLPKYLSNCRTTLASVLSTTNIRRWNMEHVWLMCCCPCTSFDLARTGLGRIGKRRCLSAEEY